MAAPNGMIEAIAQFVRQNPGCKSAEIFAALSKGVDRHSSLSVCIKRGRIFHAGPPANRRYYPDEDAAKAQNEALVVELAEAVAVSQKAKRERHNAAMRQRRKAERVARAPAPKPAPKPLTAPAVSVDGMTLAPGCKITKATPFVDRRYAPDAGFRGQITQDWWERRFIKLAPER